MCCCAVVVVVVVVFKLIAVFSNGFSWSWATSISIVHNYPNCFLFHRACTGICVVLVLHSRIATVLY